MLHFAQLVLPLSGTLLLEIEGRQGRLDPVHAAFVAPRAWHSQASAAPNQSIILDLDLASMAPEAAGRLLDTLVLDAPRPASRLARARAWLSPICRSPSLRCGPGFPSRER